MYCHICDGLRRGLGEPQATGLLARAIEARGREIGRAFARYGPADLAGLRDAFLAFVPDEGRMFAPRVERCDGGGLDIKLQRCPLKEAWHEAGVSDADVAPPCRIAGRVGNGPFPAAGLQFP